MARQVWVIPPDRSPDSLESEVKSSAAGPTANVGATERRRGRHLKPKGKKHEPPASPSDAQPSPPEGGGISAAPDHPRR